MAHPEAAGPIISHENLAAHARANNPVGWPLAEFCNYVTHDRAGLGDLLQSSVSLARLCKAETHDYVVLKVECAHLFRLDSDIWMKCERRPALVRLGSLLSHEPRAADTVTMSFQESKVSQIPPRNSMETPGLQFSDVVILWRIIQDYSSLFKLGSLGSTWFASVIWENLTQLFPTEPTFTNRDELIKRVVRSVGSARDQTKDVTRMFLARSRVRLGPITPGSHRFSTTGSDRGMSPSDKNSLSSSPRGKVSSMTPMNSRNQIGGARQSWSDGAGPVPEGNEFYQSPESLAGHSELPRLDGFTPGAPFPANYSLLPTHPIDDSLHTVRASQSKGQGGEQPHLEPYVQENILGIFLPQTQGLPIRNGEEKNVEEIPYPFQQMDSMSPASSTSAIWADHIRELREATDVEDLSGQFDHTYRRWVAAGGYSDVYLTYWRSPTQSSLIPVCYKALRPMNDMRPVHDGIQKVINRLKREMRAWKNLNHPHIVRFIGFAIEYQSYGTTAALVSEWCRNGHVIQYLRSNTAANRQMLVSEVAQGLWYLHSRKPPIVHGDVKPQNVLVTDAGCAQLCDFGLSRVLDDRPSGYTTSVQGGTTRYLAPELLLGTNGPNGEVRPTTESDVYAFACTCVQILFDHPPYHSWGTDYHVMRAIEYNEAPWEWGNSPLESVLASCCSRSGSDRPPMWEVIHKLSAYPPYS